MQYLFNSIGNTANQIINIHIHILTLYCLRVLLGIIIPIFQLTIYQDVLVFLHILSSICTKYYLYNENILFALFVFHYIEVMYILLNSHQCTSIIFITTNIYNILYSIFTYITNNIYNLFNNVKSINNEYNKIQKIQDEENNFNYAQSSYSYEKKENSIEKNNIPPQTNIHSQSKSILSTDLLTSIQKKEEPISIEEQAKKLEQACKEFKFNIQIHNVTIGPSVITYEVIPESGLKMKHFMSYSNDIARIMSVKSTVITLKPDSNLLQIQIPRKEIEFYSVKDILESEIYKKSPYDLPIIIGKKMDGRHKIIDLSTTPHLLLAGTTGSGKSVQINIMIISLIFKFHYSECQFIMIDPKMLELSVYSKIPHLLMPVITKPKHALKALQWCIEEMNRRYSLMQKYSTRNIKNFNTKIKNNIIKDEQKLPYIIIIIDEFADLILVEKNIESEIQRLAQMARAAGIHLIIGTQRPSANVITGVIKASLPARICLKVSSSIDSNITLNEKGAENLLGKGDLFLKLSGENKERILGPYITEEEIEGITSKLYDPNANNHKIDIINTSNIMINDSDNSELTNEVYKYFLSKHEETGNNNVSISEAQRKFKIGFNKAASIIEELENKKMITAPLNDSGKRKLIL